MVYITRQAVLNEIEDLVVNFLYYDRAEDEDLPSGSIEQAILYQVITIDDILAKFREGLERAIGYTEPTGG